MSEFDELPPLRKKTTSGQVQVRRARTAEQIQRARKDGHENLLKRAIIGNRSSPDYVVSEVIVFMMRDTKKVSINAGIDQAAFATSASCSAALIMS